MLSWAGGILPSCPPADNSEFVTSKADKSLSKNRLKQNKNVICLPGGPYWEKLCPRSMYEPRPLASVLIQDFGLAHFFSIRTSRPANNKYLLDMSHNFCLGKASTFQRQHAGPYQAMERLRERLVIQHSTQKYFCFLNNILKIVWRWCLQKAIR